LANKLNHGFKIENIPKKTGKGEIDESTVMQTRLDKMRRSQQQANTNINKKQ